MEEVETELEPEPAVEAEAEAEPELEAEAEAAAGVEAAAGAEAGAELVDAWIQEATKNEAETTRQFTSCQATPRIRS